MSFQTLLLNATYEPLTIVNWQHAVGLKYTGKIEVLAEYDRLIRSERVTWNMPSVVKLVKPVYIKHHGIRFSRLNVYLRDAFTCQYCGLRLPPSELTLDHVISRRQGGRMTWTNIVTACNECNKRKGPRSLEESGMKLLKKPACPKSLPVMQSGVKISTIPKSWEKYFESYMSDK